MKRPLRQWWELFRRSLGTIRVRSLTLTGRFGLSDPAATGELYGYLQGGLAVLPDSRRVYVAVTPVFDQTVVALTIRGRVQLIPARLIGTWIWFFLTVRPDQEEKADG